MIESFEPSQLTSTIAALLTGVGSTAFLLRRKFSKDNVEIVKDRAEENVISHLEKQRDFALLERDKMYERLKKAEDEREVALNRVNKLSGDVENLSGQVKLLNELVERLGISLDHTRRQLENYMTENSRLLTLLEK